MKTVTSLMSMVVILTCCVLATSNTTQAESLSLGMGTSYLNQTLDGERGPNLLTTDFQFRLDRPDAAATYRARLHGDELIWQRLEVGPRYKNVSLFYSLDFIPGTNMNLSGGGISFTQTQGIGRSLHLTGGVYDRGYCAEATCSVERNGFVGRVGYSYQKLQDYRYWGPSVSIGWGW